MQEWKGLHKDNRASRQPKDYWREAKNILMEDYVPSNELGPEVTGSFDGDTVGHVTIGDIVFVFTRNSFGIKVFKLEGNSRSGIGAFSTNRQIDYLVGQAQYDYKGDITIIFGGPGTPLYFIDTSNPPTTEEDALYQPIVDNKDPFYAVIAGGILPQGTYYLAVKYKDGVKESGFTHLSTPILVGSENTYRLEDEQLTNTAIRCTIDLGDYTTCDIAILKTSPLGVTTTHLYVNRSDNFDIVRLPEQTIALEELVPKASIFSPKSITTHNNRYYIGGYSTDDPRPDLQQFTNDNVDLRVSKLSYTPTYPYTRAGLNNKSLLSGEVYAFYIAYRYPEGHLTPFYHIPGPHIDDFSIPANPTDTITQPNGTKTKKRFQVEDTSYGDKFGYWENAEDYPDTTYNGQRIYPTGKVRFHKVPTVTPKYNTDGSLLMDYLYPKFHDFTLPDGFVDVVLACAKHDQGLRITDDLLFGGLQNYEGGNGSNELYNYRTPIGNMNIVADANDTGNTPNYAYPIPNKIKKLANSNENSTLYNNGGNVFFSCVPQEEINESCYFVPNYRLKSNNAIVRYENGQQIITLRDLTNKNDIQDNSTKEYNDNPFPSSWIDLVDPRNIEANTITGNISNYMNSQCTILRPETQVDSENGYTYCYDNPISEYTLDPLANIDTDSQIVTINSGKGSFTTLALGNAVMHITKGTGNIGNGDKLVNGKSYDIYGTFYRNIDSVYTSFWNQRLTILSKHTYNQPINYQVFTGDAYTGFRALHLSHPDSWSKDQEMHIGGSSETTKFGRVLYYYYTQSTKNIRLTREIRGNALSNEAGNENTIGNIKLYPQINLISTPKSFSRNQTTTGPILSRPDPSNDIDTAIENDPYSFTIFNPYSKFVSNLPSTVIRSTVFTNKYISRPRFLINDTYTLSGEFGPIQNISSFQGKLLIHTLNNLYITASKEEIQTDSLSISIGSGDIFRIQPSSMFQTGYGGLPSPYSALSTRLGYTWIDPNNGIFLFDGKIQNLSFKGLFHTHRDEFSKSTNFSIGHDEYNERLIYSYMYDNLPKSWSYHTMLQSWISEHDYTAPYIASTPSTVYLLDNNTRILNRVPQQFYIDIVFNAPKKVVFSSISIETECVKNQQELIETFDYIIAYNNTQCGGQQNLDASRDEGVYRYNQLWDLTDANEKYNRIILDGKSMHALYKGIPNRKKRRFRGEYMIVRLIGLNKDRKLYLHKIEPYIVPSP